MQDSDSTSSFHLQPEFISLFQISTSCCCRNVTPPLSSTPNQNLFLFFKFPHLVLAGFWFPLFLTSPVRIYFSSKFPHLVLVGFWLHFFLPFLAKIYFSFGNFHILFLQDSDILLFLFSLNIQLVGFDVHVSVIIFSFSFITHRLSLQGVYYIRCRQFHIVKYCCGTVRLVVGQVVIQQGKGRCLVLISTSIGNLQCCFQQFSLISLRWG